MVMGVLVALLPILGFPKSWESFFQVIAGVSIVSILVWSSIDKKLALKAKAQQRQLRKSPIPESEISIKNESNTFASDFESNKI